MGLGTPHWLGGVPSPAVVGDRFTYSDTECMGYIPRSIWAECLLLTFYSSIGPLTPSFLLAPPHIHTSAEDSPTYYGQIRHDFHNGHRHRCGMAYDIPNQGSAPLSCRSTAASSPPPALTGDHSPFDSQSMLRLDLERKSLPFSATRNCGVRIRTPWDSRSQR